MKIKITIDYILTHEAEVDIDLSDFDINDKGAIDEYLVTEAAKGLSHGEVVGWEYDDSAISNFLKEEFNKAWDKKLIATDLRSSKEGE